MLVCHWLKWAVGLLSHYLRGSYLPLLWLVGIYPVNTFLLQTLAGYHLVDTKKTYVCLLFGLGLILYETKLRHLGYLHNWRHWNRACRTFLTRRAFILPPFDNNSSICQGMPTSSSLPASNLGVVIDIKNTPHIFQEENYRLQVFCLSILGLWHAYSECGHHHLRARLLQHENYHFQVFWVNLARYATPPLA